MMQILMELGHGYTMHILEVLNHYLLISDSSLDKFLPNHGEIVIIIIHLKVYT